MAEAVVSIALKTIGDLLLEEGKFLLGVEDEVRTLQTQLKEVKCFLKDAGGKQHKSESVRNWMAEIRDLAYRAEDAIAAYAVRSSSDRRRRRRLLGGPTTVLSRCYSYHQLGSEISNIISELARVTKNMDQYGIRSIIDGAGSESDSPNQNWERRTFPDFQIEDCFVGMEYELRWLVSLVADDEHRHHRVVSVWGMGGIGKTTIARKVYNQMMQTGNRCFDSFAWVCITQQCQIRTVLEDVLGQLRGVGIPASLRDSQLIEELCTIQRGKRCLIVIDDLWETSHWDAFKHAFLVRDLKSKILVTTRKQKVAEIGFSVELGLLDMDGAWELLKKKAFPQANIPADISSQEIELQRIGKEMVRKCGFLPLAVSLLGGVLSEKKSLSDWELVNDNIDAFIYFGEGHDGKGHQIDGVLSLSYEDLPYYLKLCFLYLGVLKEDESIRVGDLYRMWIAQGMISYEHGRGKEETLMEIAELCLSELASRCLVQVEVDGGVTAKKFKSCKLHDVVRELCLSMGRKEFYSVQTLKYEGGRLSALLHDALERIETRHLAIRFKSQPQLECGHDHELKIEEENSKHLRSLSMHNDTQERINLEFPVDFRKFKSLRGLSFIRFKFEGGKLPRGITDLVHLRYFCLRYCAIDELPPSISNLVYLETLDLFFARNTRIPNVLKKMFRLKHLLLPYYDKERIGNYRLRLDEGLDQLETLMGFNSSVHELSCVTRMKNLQRFSAYIYDGGSYSAVLNAIATNWNGLVNCVVKVYGFELTVMELKQAFTCPNLHALGISVELRENLLRQCVSEMVCSNLARLYLMNCRIDEDPMEILGKLPCLTELCFWDRSFVGEEMTCPAFSFPRLNKFKLIKLSNLREWRVEEGAMSALCELHVCHCPRLENVPDRLSDIFTLQNVIIRGMPELWDRVSIGRRRDLAAHHLLHHFSKANPPHVSTLQQHLHQRSGAFSDTIISSTIVSSETASRLQQTTKCR
ncbi:hypothetical protein C2S51_037383 [Perilla frutescens var. frutescens]|nr:hypothetical protein C2S51_037383 [Perilla frutescens var. frutescens]